jgi:Tol biopolymer transport system component
MKDISHKQAVRLIHLHLDGLLNASQRRSLDEHLASCDSCRAYAAEMDVLTGRLQNEFQARWDRNTEPSHRVSEYVSTKARKIPVTTRISSALRLMASVSVVAVLLLGINFMISQMKSNSIDTIGTQSVSGSELINNRLIAFTSEKDGNFDIYTMSADGNNLTNLTNNPAQDANPVWSPDGKRIAFESDRDGFTQIYLMDGDGSNVIQFTDDKADHNLPLNVDNKSNPWSPDGSKLLFLQSSSGGEVGNLYVKQINGENKVLLASGRFSHNDLSWSPNGTYIAYVLNESPTPNETFVTGIYVVDSNGNNAQELKKLIPQNEKLGSPYYWSSDGQSIVFIADENDGSGQIVYEFALESNTLLQKDILKQEVIDWHDEISLVSERSAFVWQRSDGTSNTLDWDDSNCLLDITRSLQGSFAIGAYCPDSKKFKLYWANFDGSTIKQLLESPTMIGQLWDIVWSPDDQHIAFNISLPNKTDMYVLNVSESLSNPSAQPVQVSVSGGELFSIPSWQPILINEVAINEPTPEPTQIVESDEFPPIGTGKEGNGKWIAFLVSPDGIKSDVHMIHPDGSGLCCTNNLTNSPDHYFWLEWSPNGNDLLFLRDPDTSGGIDILRKIEPIGFEVLVDTGVSREAPFLYRWSPNSEQIAYIDNLTGNFDIYTIYADGRDDIQPKQLTNDSGQEIDFAWSPDGRQIAYQRTNGEQLSIMVMNADGSNQHEVARGKGKVRLYWSVNGNSIYVSSTENNWLECEGCVQAPGIYQIDLNGLSVRQLYYEMDADQYTGWYLYDTPQGILYFMRIDPPDFVELWGTWFRADGNSVTEIGKLDPQQTCQTATGNVLNERISPNSRFSVISNFCDGSFDLYLADREAIPDKRFNHLLQLPLDTLGQGGDFATLPMTWSPDGRWIAYDNGNSAIYLLNIEATRQHPVNKRRTGGPLLLWQSENDLITFSEIAWQPISNPEVVDEEPTPEPTQTSSSDSLIAFTADNNNAANTNMDIYTMHADGSQVTNITNNSANDSNPAWSPDGTRIAFVSDRNGNLDIFVMNPDGSGLTQITDSTSNDNFFSWSPDGKKIIYSSNTDSDPNTEDSQLFSMSSDGHNKTLLTNEPGSYYFVSWSPNGQRVVFVKQQPNPDVKVEDAGIYVMDADGSNKHEWFIINNVPGIHWEDAQHFYGVVLDNISYDHTVWSIYRFNINGESPQIIGSHDVRTAPILAIFEKTYVVEHGGALRWYSLDGGRDSLATWKFSDRCEKPLVGDGFIQNTSHVISPDGKNAFVTIRCNEGVTWFYLENANGSEFKQLTDFSITDQQIATGSWSPDGKYILVRIENWEGTSAELYLLDIQKMLNDPSVQPVQLTTDGAWKYGAVWQPVP